MHDQKKNNPSDLHQLSILFLKDVVSLESREFVNDNVRV